MRPNQVLSGSRVGSGSRSLTRRFFRRVLQHRIICCAVALNLLIWPGPGLLTEQLLAFASEVLNTRIVSHSYEAFFLRRLFSRSPARPRRETTAERTASVTSIQITPARIVGYTGQLLRFSAKGMNGRGETIQGAQFSWSSSDGEKLQIDGSGQATLIEPGLVWIAAATPNVSARVPVLGRGGCEENVRRFG
jgi:hypothetical protein